MIMAPIFRCAWRDVPAVENSVSGSAYFPATSQQPQGLLSRSAIRRRGRLVLADALRNRPRKPRADALPCDSHGCARAATGMELRPSSR